MKTVLLLRHAKSDWDSSFGHDRERPINKRGKKEARRMGRFLADVDFLPDRIVCSSAVRARTTLEFAVDEGSWDEQISTKLTDELYDTTSENALALIQQQDDAFSRLLLVGHEPTWSRLVGALIGRANLRITTATLVRVDFNVPRWQDVDPGSGELRWLVPAKLLRKSD